MAKSTSVPFGTFQWIVSGCLGAIVGLVALLYHGITSDISDLKTGQTKLTDAINANQVQTIQALGDIKTQIAITNTKLDTLNQQIQPKHH